MDTARVIQDGPFSKGEFDRGIYFRSYQSLGQYNDERHSELESIGAIPARGTFRFYLEPDEDPSRVFTPESLEYTLNQRENVYRQAKERGADLAHAVAHGPYQEWMRVGESSRGRVDGLEDWELQARGNILRSDLFEPVADVIVQWYHRFKEWDVHFPVYYTVQNEPITSWNVDAFARYSKIVADRMAEEHPDVFVAGPCSAWPYPLSDWSMWRDWQSRFIDIAGGSLGAYDLHFYSKGHWSLPRNDYWQARRVESPFLYANQKQSNTTVWDFGRLDAYLDLWNAYHLNVWGGETKPMIVSEFGRQTIYPQFGPWINEFWPWLYMTTVTRMWMVFMDRPEVKLTVPFILGESGSSHSPMRGQAIYTRLNAPDSMELSVTRFRDFYAFFRDIDGTRLTFEVESDASDIDKRLFALALRSGDHIYLLLHNGAPSLDAQMNLALNTLINSEYKKPDQVLIKRLYYEGPIPDPMDNERSADGTLHIAETDGYEKIDGSQITLAGEEIAIVRLDYAEGMLPDITREHREMRFYSVDTLNEFTAGRLAEANIELPDPLPEGLQKARLRLGLARDGGFDQNPRVAFNEARLPAIDLEHTLGIADYFAPSEINIPLDSLKPGSNRIRVAFPTVVRGGSPYLVSARMDLVIQDRLAEE